METNNYFSVKIRCCTFSASLKNSSISCAVGICLHPEFSFLLLTATELAALVVEPGVKIVSEFLIRLLGVVSLVFLHPSKRNEIKEHLSCNYLSYIIDRQKQTLWGEAKVINPV